MRSGGLLLGEVNENKVQFLSGENFKPARSAISSRGEEVLCQNGI